MARFMGVPRPAAHHSALSTSTGRSPRRVRARAAWAKLAADRTRWIELRVLALDTASALAPDGAGVPLDAALADPDPALRRIAIEDLVSPLAAEHRTAVAKALVSDTDDAVARAAGAALCFDGVELDAPARQRIAALRIKCGKR